MTTVTTNVTMTQAIARSISHNECVHVYMADMVRQLREDATERGDTEMAAKCTDYLDGIEEETRADVISALATDADDYVVNGDIVEMWGTDGDGDEWRVMIHLAG